MLVDAGRWRDGYGNGSGCRQDVVRGSIWCAGACAVISGVIVSPAVISGSAIGCVNSFPFVGSGSGSGSGGGGWLMRRYAPPICIADMHRRYALPIWCDDMHGLKTEKAKSILLLALMLFTFVIRYFTFVV
jgi:hypothetical protein